MEHGYLKGLEERRSFLQDSQFWSKTKLTEYQDKQLQLLVNHAYGNVPFYRELYDAHGVDIDSFKGILDINQLPIVDKEMMRDADVNCVDDRLNAGDLITMTTGGSTGNPFKIYMDKRFKAYNHANTYYYMDVLGFKPKRDRSVRLHGDIFPEELISEGIYWIERDNKLVLSSYHLNRKTVAIYLEKIKAFCPKYIHAYPSALWMFAKLLQVEGLQFDFPLGCVFLDSEKIYSQQKAFLKELFNCPVYQTYAHTEGAVLGISCKESDKLHMLPQVGIFELLDSNGMKVNEEGKVGQIVVTGFNNYVMPFIRYRTGDLGVFTDQKCGCGREWPLLKEVEGRKQDYVVNRNGELCAIGATLFDYNIDWSGIESFRVCQDKPGELDLKIVPTHKNSDILSRLGAQLDKFLGDKFDLTLQQVEMLEYTHIGKFRYLEQKLDLSQFGFVDCGYTINQEQQL